MEDGSSKGKALGGQRGKMPLDRAAITSGIAKPEFKKHIHTNNAKNKYDDSAVETTGAVLSRRKLKNLAKRKKKEAAAAACGHETNISTSSSAPHSALQAPSSGGNSPALPKVKKAPLDPGKKAEVNCNWQALKKALVSGGPIITRSGLLFLMSHKAKAKGVCFYLAAECSAQPKLCLSQRR